MWLDDASRHIFLHLSLSLFVLSRLLNSKDTLKENSETRKVSGSASEEIDWLVRVDDRRLYGALGVPDGDADATTVCRRTQENALGAGTPCKGLMVRGRR